MKTQRIIFSPVTRLSGLLSVEVTVEKNRVKEAYAGSTMFRGYEWIMRDRHVTDAVYMTQRVCGICSLAHGAVSSYLLDDLYDNDIPENAHYLRNIMFAADFLQNHIRHFYLFSLPDYVRMPDRPPFHEQDITDVRLVEKDNRLLVEHYFAAVKAAQRSHEILAVFGGKAPHQHSFVHGGAAVSPTADKVNRALALIDSINRFIKDCMIPDTALIARVYNDYFHIGITPRRLLSFGLFRFGAKNDRVLWKGGVLSDDKLDPPEVKLIETDVTRSWFEDANVNNLTGRQPEPAPYKPDAYTWVKSVLYGGRHFEVGPLARMIINRRYDGGTSTMDRICARSLETMLIGELLENWLTKLEPGPPPIKQKTSPVKSEAVAVTDSMRGALLHSALLNGERVVGYEIITPTEWNFSPKDRQGRRGPVENALVDTAIPRPKMLFTVLGRIIRSFDPCLSCATHIINVKS
ncbi:MAG: nickel-dependent hydrogenase large subunit [Bacillota bacterium]